MFIATFNENKEYNYIFDKQKSFLRKKGFVWCVYFVAYRCEAQELYKEIHDKWSDFDSITGKGVAFVIADESASTFFHLGNEIERMQYVPKHDGHSFAETNTLMAGMCMEVFDITHKQVPCLVFRNLLNDNLNPIIVSLKDDSDLYSILKYISIRVKDCSDKLEVILNRISNGYRGIETYLDMVNRFIRVSNGYINKGETAEHIIDQLPNSYAERRLIDYWDIVMPKNKKIWGNSEASSLAKKIIDLRIKLGDDFERKRDCYNQMMSEVNLIHDEIYNIVSKIDVCRCRRDALSYAYSQVEELERILKKTNLIMPIEMTNNFNEIRDYLIDEDEIKRGGKTALEKLESIRSSQFVKLVDDYSRVITLIGLIEKVIDIFV